jgi:acetyl esterase/lipase
MRGWRSAAAFPPLYHITSNLPPTLILHGDADKLVPFQQAESFVGGGARGGRPVPVGGEKRRGPRMGQTGWATSSCLPWSMNIARGSPAGGG